MKMVVRREIDIQKEKTEDDGSNDSVNVDLNSLRKSYLHISMSIFEVSLFFMYIGMVFKKSRVNDMMFLSSTRFPPVEILYPQVHSFSTSQGEERRQKPSIDRND